MSVASLASLPHQPWGHDRDPLGQTRRRLCKGHSWTGGTLGFIVADCAFVSERREFRSPGNFSKVNGDGFWGEIQL